MSFLIDDRAQLFGLPKSMLVPIAARSVEDVELYVGVIEEQIVGLSGRVNALAVGATIGPQISNDDCILNAKSGSMWTTRHTARLTCA